MLPQLNFIVRIKISLRNSYRPHAAFILLFANKKRGTFRRSALTTPTTALQHTQSRDVPCKSMDIPILKVCCSTSYFRSGSSVRTFTISLPNFLFSDRYCFYTSIIFPAMQHALRLTIIYHAVGQNTRTKIQKDVFLSKMPLDKGSAAMGYLRFCFVVWIEAIRVILISRQRFSKRSYSAEERNICKHSSLIFHFFIIRSVSGVLHIGMK